jgi:type II secretory ATPase GspE/PulE/Tfp pilus assembly ATPase PilB-like protein
LLVNDTLEEAIADQATATELEPLAVSQGMLRLPDVAHSYVLRGITSVEEANRVCPDPRFLNLQSRDGD